MRYWWLGALLLAMGCLQLKAQMKAPEEWVNYEQVLGVKTRQRSYDYNVSVIKSSTNTNVLWPGDQPVYTVQVVNNLSAPLKIKGKVDLICYGTKGRPNDVWLPEMVKLADISSVPVTVDIAANGYVDLELKPLIPATFGGYALVLDLGQYGRRLISSMVRTFPANPKRLQFPKQSLDDMGPEFLQRLGIQAIRMGVDYTPTTAKDYEAKMAAMDAKLQQYKEKNITVLLMFGAGSAEMPLGMPRTFLDSNNVMRKTKMDLVWLPSGDADFNKFVNRLCVKHGWPNGPVTAVSLWNEPWEGLSISGWQSDIPRYREIYTAMANAVLDARKKGAQVLVGGGDSNSNAWDKLFADGKMTFLPIFDFCSIHYQGMETPSIYPEWVNRKSPNGRVKVWDTESWVGNTDDRIGLTVATNRSTGYDRSIKYRFTQPGTYDVALNGQSKSRVIVGDKVQQPFAVFANAKAAFYQVNTNTFWGFAGGTVGGTPIANNYGERTANDVYGTVYLPGGMTDNCVATVRIHQQQKTSNYAKVGIMVRNKITEPGKSGGYCVAAVSSYYGGGGLLEWDNRGSGFLDSLRRFGLASFPNKWIRVERHHKQFIIWSSADGQHWKKQTSIMIPSANVIQDVGVFVTSDNPAELCHVIFSDFSVFKTNAFLKETDIAKPIKKEKPFTTEPL